MPEERKSIKEILTELRNRNLQPLKDKEVNFSVKASSIAAMFAADLNKLFDEKEKNKDYPIYIMRRKDIVHFLGPAAVEKQEGKAPKIKAYIRERLRAYGISAYHKGGFVEFTRIKQKKNPQV